MSRATPSILAVNVELLLSIQSVAMQLSSFLMEPMLPLKPRTKTLSQVCGILLEAAMPSKVLSHVGWSTSPPLILLLWLGKGFAVSACPPPIACYGSSAVWCYVNSYLDRKQCLHVALTFFLYRTWIAWYSGISAFSLLLFSVLMFEVSHMPCHWTQLQEATFILMYTTRLTKLVHHHLAI